MKNSIKLITLAVFATVGISSCTQCQICTKTSEPEIRFCEDDYDSNTQYGLAIDVAEAGGYTCK